jgi:hypothetical protein
MSNNTRKLTRDADAATAKVADTTARRDRIRDERDGYAVEVEDRTARIQAALARGERTDDLERERRALEAQRDDRDMVLPTIEQQLAETRAELDAATGQLVNATREAAVRATIMRGQALDAKERAHLEDTAALRASLRDDVAELAHLDEEADRHAGRKHMRGPQSIYAVAREVPLLLNYHQVLASWDARRPALVEVPAAPPSASDPLAERLARAAGGIR